MKLVASICASGEYKIISHTGHVRDESGRIVQLGRVLSESEWQSNTITADGLAMFLSTDNSQLAGVRMEDSIGRYIDLNEFVSAVTARSSATDPNGEIWWQTAWRFTGSFSGDTRVLRLQRASVRTVGGKTVSTASLPAFVVDLKDEKFDVIWRMREYCSALTKGTAIVSRYQKGVLVDKTYVGYKLRPCNFENVTDSTQGWMPISTVAFPHLAPIQSRFKLGVGTIGPTVVAQPVFAEFILPNAMTVVRPSPDTAIVGVAYDVPQTLSGEVFDAIQFMAGHWEWQVQFDGPVTKSNYILKVELGITVKVR